MSAWHLVETLTAEEAAESQAWVAEVTERAERGDLKDEKNDIRALFFEELRKLNLR